jgi:serine/threonine-protein kinase
MGVVYRARHRDLDRPIALKVLHRELSDDATVVARFKREARAASSLGHPHIIHVHDFGRLEDGSAYLAMELFDGRSLRAIIAQEGALSVPRVVRLATQIADALGAAHAAGVIHRDLKPDNVLVGADDAVKIVDFGIAKVAVSAEAARLTGTDELIGTPLYMSPEQCRGRDVDARADVYALGAILFEMLTGRPPFHGESVVALVTAHLFEEPPRPSALRAGVPEPLEEVVLACLAKDADHRPPTMSALAQHLELALVDAGSAPTVRAERPEVAKSASAPTSTSRAPTSTSSAPTSTSSAPTSPGRARDLRLGWIAAAGVVVAMATAGLLLAFDAPTPPAPIGPAAPPRVADPAPAPDELAEPAPAPHVLLDSEPSEAEVREGQALLGHTPLVVDSDRGRTVHVSHAGYEAQTVELEAGASEPRRVSLEPTRPRERRGGARARPDHPTNALIRDPWER